jgi:ABC-type transport system involved in multi-copper enzyme maturation permease subunit
MPASPTAADRLRALSPFGPIFGKELRATARRKRSYLLRVAYLGLLLLVLLWVWAIEGARSGGGLAAQAQSQAAMGALFFFTFSVFTVTAMAAVGPVLTCTAVGSERLAKTLPVLLMTPISAWQIAAGKLFSRALIALTLLGLSLPVLAVVRLLGGVELWEMGAVLALSAATMLFTAALGLLLSTLMNRAYAVILLSYGILLLLYFFVPLIVEANLNGTPGGQRIFFDWLAWNNPFITTALIAEPTRTAARFGANLWPWCVVAHLAGTALLLGATALLLRRISRRLGEGGAPAAGAEPIEPAPPESVAAGDSNGASSSPVLAYSSPKRSARRRKARPIREVSDRPVLWKELRRPLMTRPWQAMVGFLASLGLLVTTYFTIANDRSGALMRPDNQIGYAVVFNGLAWLLVSVLAATVIAQEKEGDTWTLLLATPLSGRAIVWGKVGGLLRRVAWPAALMAGHFALFTALGVISPVTFLLILWVIVTFNSVWVATGVHLSLRFRKVTVAVIVNLLLAVAAYAIAPMVLAIAGELLNHRGEDWGKQAFWYQPYFYLGVWIDRAGSTMGIDRFGYELPANRHVTGQEFLTVAFFAGLAHLLAAGLILRHTARRFDRMVGRAPQHAPLPAGPVPAVAT